MTSGAQKGRVGVGRASPRMWGPAPPLRERHPAAGAHLLGTRSVLHEGPQLRWRGACLLAHMGMYVCPHAHTPPMRTRPCAHIHAHLGWHSHVHAHTLCIVRVRDSLHKCPGTRNMHISVHAASGRHAREPHAMHLHTRPHTHMYYCMCACDHATHLTVHTHVSCTHMCTHTYAHSHVAHVRMCSPPRVPARARAEVPLHPPRLQAGFGLILSARLHLAASRGSLARVLQARSPCVAAGRGLRARARAVLQAGNPLPRLPVAPLTLPSVS